MQTRPPGMRSDKKEGGKVLELAHEVQGGAIVDLDGDLDVSAA